MIDKTEVLENIDFKSFYRGLVPSLKGSAQANGKCPFHDDEKGSYSVDLLTGLWNCHKGCGEGDLISFYMKIKGLEFKTALSELAEMAGVMDRNKKEKAVYNYHNETGALLYQVVRYEPKDFRPRRKGPDGNWIYDLKGVRRVPYNLPELSKANGAVIVEGEKDVENLKTLGYAGTTAVTTSQGGAKGWKPEYADYFKGKPVVIIPDNDKPGLEYAETVAKSLIGKANNIKIVELPGLGERLEKHGLDVSDWIKLKRKEGKKDSQIKSLLTGLIISTPLWEPKEKKPKNALHFEKLGDILNLPEEEIQWLVEDILPIGGLSTMAAKPKVGKSVLSRCLAVAVAKGRKFLNQEVSQGTVLYLALEEKRSEVVKHFKSMGAIETDPIFIFFGVSPQDGLIQLKEAVVTHNPVLVIIDPLFKFARVKDSNSYTEVTAALEPLLDLARKSGSHVLLIHHGGKGDRSGGDSILGSTAILGNVDTAFIMKRSEATRSIYSIQRYGTEIEETILMMDQDTKWVTASGSKHEHDIDRTKPAILKFLTTQINPIEEKEILVKVLGKNELKVKALRSLVNEKKVERSGEGKKGNVFKYKMFVPSYPDIYREQGYENPKASNPSSQSYTDVCSLGFQSPEEETNFREQESSLLELDLSVLDLEENL